MRNETVAEGRVDESPAINDGPADALQSIERLISQNRCGEAEKIVDQLMAIYPASPDVINAKGCLLTALGDPQGASEYYIRALDLNPSVGAIWSNLGTAFKQRKQFKTAIRIYQHALSICGESPLLFHNLALCHADAGDHGRAIELFSRTLELDPHHPRAAWGRARSYLYLGNFERGWRDYESRIANGLLSSRGAHGDLWRGQPYAGKRLIVLAEQGIGDTIWASRYLRHVKALGGELIVECQPAVFSLFEALKLADCVVPMGDPVPSTDYYCHFCSLPYIVDPLGDGISGEPYFVASPWRRARFEQLLRPHANRLKVGVVWSGNITFERNRDRAIPLDDLISSLVIPGVQFFSLQKGAPETELVSCKEAGRIVDLSPEIIDFADTAAAVSELDLIIMTDSAVAHLSGALGKPVWVLLGHAPHWLWLMDRADSPWYSSMTLFRSRGPSGWTEVLDNVGARLLEQAKSKVYLQ